MPQATWHLRQSSETPQLRGTTEKSQLHSEASPLGYQNDDRCHVQRPANHNCKTRGRNTARACPLSCVRNSGRTITSRRLQRLCNGSAANQYAGCKRWVMHGSASTPEFYMLAHSLASVKEMQRQSNIQTGIMSSLSRDMQAAQSIIFSINRTLRSHPSLARAHAPRVRGKPADSACCFSHLPARSF